MIVLKMNLRPEIGGLLQDRNIPWAKVLQGTGKGVLVLDELLARRVWPSTPGQLVGVPRAAEEVTVSFPGIGSQGGAEQALHAENILPSPNAYFVQSSDGTTIEEMADILVEKAPHLQRLNINGHSMGGPSGLEVARLASRRGLDHLKLGEIVLHCSPFDLADGQHGSISRALGAVNWSTGPINKFGFQFIRELLDGKTPGAAFQQARNDATSGCASEQWMTQRTDLQGIHLRDHMDEYAAIVDERTRVKYCMPEVPSMDRSVKTVRAIGKYRPFFGNLGVPLEVYKIPNMRHAEVGLAFGHLALARESMSGI